MALTLLVCATTLFSAYTLWTRRSTWRVQWEGATTTAVIAFTAGIMLITPLVAALWDAPLHAVTGVWGLEHLIGHLTYLIGLAALLHATIGRIDLPDPQQFFRRRILLPGAVAVPVLIVVFLRCAPDHPVPDLIHDDTAPAYWLLLCATATWIIGNLMWGLSIVRCSPASRVVADIYLTALGLDGACVACLVLHAVSRFPGWPGWMFLCASCMGYTSGAWWSWRLKLQWLGLQSRGFSVTVRDSRTVARL